MGREIHPMAQTAFEHLTPYCACGSQLFPPKSHRMPNMDPTRVRCSCGQEMFALFWQLQPGMNAACDRLESDGKLEELFEEMAPVHRMESDD